MPVLCCDAGDRNSPAEQRVCGGGLETIGNQGAGRHSLFLILEKINSINNKVAINTHLSITKSKKQSKQAEQTQTHRHREHRDSCQRGGGFEGWAERVKGLEAQTGCYTTVTGMDNATE